ncbi:unnamed protein product [Gongylonema pulchrum]|uniref:Uncharacterized protein n=1 Tax=Gongylonema pulchrum TaxID=637853 RepID=A0A3P7NRP3_9BILA|nr:unnamed protein product [Gongylonema pulchrum]
MQFSEEDEEEGRKVKEEDADEEAEDRECGKLTRRLMMSETAPRVEARKLLVVLTFMVLAAFSNWIALAYIHDFVGRSADYF